MRLKTKVHFPKPWEYKPWPLCGNCFWVEPLLDPDPVPCEDCAKKYGLVADYYEEETATP